MDARTSKPDGDGRGQDANRIVKEAQRHKLLTAALIGGTVAAGAGAYVGARALARRNGARTGHPLNAVMETAITACDVGATQARH